MQRQRPEERERERGASAKADQSRAGVTSSHPVALLSALRNTAHVMAHSRIQKQGNGMRFRQIPLLYRPFHASLLLLCEHVKS
jgi:hypothetical protein